MKKLSPYNLNNTKAVMVTCGNYKEREKADEVLARVIKLYPNAGIRLETAGSARYQVVAGRYIGELAEAKAIAAEIQFITLIPTEAWKW